jgi:hypothetical protein
MRLCAGVTVLILIGAAAPVTGQRGGREGEVAAWIERIGERVREYYSRAQSVVCLETVTIQPVKPDLQSDGFPRRLAFELRVEWEPSLDGRTPPEATVRRELVKVDNRAPRPRDEPGCMDPKPVSPEPLAFLLPERSREFDFTWVGTGRVDGRDAVMFDYRPRSVGHPIITWTDECVSIELPGHERGRIWADASTADVLRIDERVTGLFEFNVPPRIQRRGAASSMVVERADTSIRYRTVAFEDPDETLHLPVSIESYTVVRNAGSPRVRRTQRFTDYRRFVTGGRVVR